MIIVTSNRGKYKEYKDMFGQIVKLELMLMKYPEEQLETIEKVAERSVYYLSGIIQTDFFIDDSGLFIDELGGFPGVYSSYVNKTLGNKGILKLMEGKRERSAEFRTCIAYYDGKLSIFTGAVKGIISKSARGSNGFGFDPIFIPDGYDKTYAEMTLKEKDSISHRFKAGEAFLKFLTKKAI
ncbi:MAG: XTP/dITP diphosphatase [Thermoplasmata archaeon]